MIVVARIFLLDKSGCYFHMNGSGMEKFFIQPGVNTQILGPSTIFVKSSIVFVTA